MHSITELKKYFQEQNVKIILEQPGAFLTTKHGRWGLAGDEYYLDHVLIERKNLKNLIENKPTKKKRK